MQGTTVAVIDRLTAQCRDTTNYAADRVGRLAGFLGGRADRGHACPYLVQGEPAATDPSVGACAGSSERPIGPPAGHGVTDVARRSTSGMGEGRVDRARARTSEIKERVPELKARGAEELRNRGTGLRSKGSELRSRGGESIR